MAKAKAKFILDDCATIDGVSGCCSLETLYDLSAEKEEVFYEVVWGGKKITPAEFKKLSQDKQDDYHRVDTKESGFQESGLRKATIAVVTLPAQRNEKAALERMGFKKVAEYTSTSTRRKCAVMFRKP